MPSGIRISGSVDSNPTASPNSSASSRGGGQQPNISYSREHTVAVRDVINFSRNHGRSLTQGSFPKGLAGVKCDITEHLVSKSSLDKWTPSAFSW